ncbi:MAG: adenosylmethionine--8-amino-7-oxononanoate transaminase [Ottowia sp.]|nr:adenosylmethionine--8-amino-7-oxononanoate transaminase [Ottowia sp.]
MNWLELDRTYCWHPFTQAHTAAPAINMVRGQGSYLFDENGRPYLDAISSWWVNLHGHAHPVIAQAIADQAHQLEHVMFAGITHPPAIILAQQLIARAPKPLQYVFYTDNGSTAVEVALKMACQYWRNQGSTRTRFLAFDGAYHGDTFGAMATGKSSGFYTPFTDWLFEVDFLPYPATWDGHHPESIEKQALDALDVYLNTYGNTLVAFILEPLVQGASGMRMARPHFLRKAIARVQAQGIPVIFDEVMTGFGRTGSFFAAEQIGLTPDILCLSKGLTAGFLPMGAAIAQPHIYEAFLDNDIGKALLHGHSYMANPLGCAAASASLQVFDQEATLTRIQTLIQIQRSLLNTLAHHPAIRHTRQCGTITAFDITTNDSTYNASAGLWLREKMRERNILLRPLGNTVYLLPPYCITDAELHSIYQHLQEVLDQWSTSSTITTSTDLF